MTKKILFTLVCILSFSLSSYAQENGNRDANGKIVRGPYETNRFWDNWYVELGSGATMYLGGFENEFKSPIHENYNFSFGKWITPCVGFRVTIGFTSQVGTDDYKFDYWNAHADFMYNLSNALGGYKETRVYQVIPYVGAGYGKTGFPNYISKCIGVMTINAGIINKFRVSNRIDLNLELAGTFIKHTVDRREYGNQVVEDFPLAAIASITFKLGKTNFKRVSKQVETIDNSSVINALKAENADLLDKNGKLAKELAALKGLQPQTVEKNVYGDLPKVSAVFFEIASSKLSKTENVHLDDFAYAVKQSLAAGKSVTLVGSADKPTGESKGNMLLSQQRIDVVMNVLAKKYGIDTSKIKVRAEGDTNNRFHDSTLDRCVLIVRE